MTRYKDKQIRSGRIPERRILTHGGYCRICHRANSRLNKDKVCPGCQWDIDEAGIRKLECYPDFLEIYWELGQIIHMFPMDEALRIFGVDINNIKAGGEIS